MNAHATTAVQARRVIESERRLVLLGLRLFVNIELWLVIAAVRVEFHNARSLLNGRHSELLGALPRHTIRAINELGPAHWLLDHIQGGRRRIRVRPLVEPAAREERRRSKPIGQAVLGFLEEA